MTESSQPEANTGDEEGNGNNFYIIGAAVGGGLLLLLLLAIGYLVKTRYCLEEPLLFEEEIVASVSTCTS